MEPWSHVYYPWFSSGMVVAVVVFHTRSGSIHCTLSRCHLCPVPVVVSRITDTDFHSWHRQFSCWVSVFSGATRLRSINKVSLFCKTSYLMPLTVTNPWSETIFLKIVVTGLLCSILYVSVSFQGRIMFADLLAVEGMKNLIMWSCSFRWVMCFCSLPCPVEMASQGRTYSERIRPRTGVETFLYIKSGWNGRQWEGGDVAVISLRYFIALLFCFRCLSVNSLWKTLKSECLQELSTVLCSSGSCLKYLLLSSAAFKIGVLYQSSECSESQWCHISNTVFSMKGSDLWLTCLCQAQQ